jgi:hypothetical protein
MPVVDTNTGKVLMTDKELIEGFEKWFAENKDRIEKELREIGDKE